MDRYLLLLLAIVTCACNSSDPGSNPNNPGSPDASVPDAGEQNYCTKLNEDYGDLGLVTGTATVTPIDDDSPDGPQLLTLQMPLNNDVDPDVLFLELYEQEGPFVDGFSAKTISLQQEQADITNCSACAYIAANYIQGDMIDFHMTYSGQLELEVIDPTPDTGQVKGSLSGLKLHAITIDPETDPDMPQQITEMGCKSNIDTVTFDFQIAIPPL